LLPAHVAKAKDAFGSMLVPDCFIWIAAAATLRRRCPFFACTAPASALRFRARSLQTPQAPTSAESACRHMMGTLAAREIRVREKPDQEAHVDGRVILLRH
jgi:hypothetical protein